MDYRDEANLGRWIKSVDVNSEIPIQNIASEGYISYFGTPQPFEDYMYLYPIPFNDIVLNPNLNLTRDGSI